MAGATLLAGTGTGMAPGLQNAETDLHMCPICLKEFSRSECSSHSQTSTLASRFGDAENPMSRPVPERFRIGPLKGLPSGIGLLKIY